MNAPHLTADLIRRFERAEADNARLRLEAIGCDSVDGTFLTFGPDTNLPRLLAWTRLNDHPTLTDANGRAL